MLGRFASAVFSQPVAAQKHNVCRGFNDLARKDRKLRYITLLGGDISRLRSRFSKCGAGAGQARARGIAPIAVLLVQLSARMDSGTFVKKGGAGLSLHALCPISETCRTIVGQSDSGKEQPFFFLSSYLLKKNK